jgi:excisionase family DNA binding protein
VANILQVSPKTVTRWAREGKLPHSRTLGGHRRYPGYSIRKLATELFRSDDGFVPRGRRLRVRPMPWLRSDPGDPMHAPVAAPAMEQDVPELSLKLGLRLQELHPQALGCGDESRLIARVNFVCFLDDSVGVGCSVGDGLDGALEDLPLASPRHRLDARGCPLQKEIVVRRDSPYRRSLIQVDAGATIPGPLAMCGGQRLQSPT